jgi:sigma-B regulation protein RsbU (phosphoserine phosphatase)
MAFQRRWWRSGERHSSKTRRRYGREVSLRNERLQDMADERFVTAFYGVIDRKTRRLTYANAGHPFPLWYSARRKTCEDLPARGFLLGVMPDEVFVERSVELEPGDRIFLYTDGVADCRDEQGATFGADRLRSQLVVRGQECQPITEAFVEGLKQFRGSAKPWMI